MNASQSLICSVCAHPAKPYRKTCGERDCIAVMNSRAAKIRRQVNGDGLYDIVVGRKRFTKSGRENTNAE